MTLEKIPRWDSRTAYPMGAQVMYGSRVWIASTAIPAGPMPGQSSLWIAQVGEKAVPPSPMHSKRQ